MKMWKRKIDVRLIFLVTFVIFLCYTSVTDAAAVQGFKMSKKELEALKSLVENASVLRKNYNKGIRVPRAAKNSDEEDASKRHCHFMPCGWGVYDSYTRNVLYFMRNTCECPDKSYKCVRVGDDLSASAYVYRCRQNTTDSLEFPPTEENVN